MCNPVEIEFKNFLSNLKDLNLKKLNDFIYIFEINKKNIKFLLLSCLMEHIKIEKSFALYDEEIFEIYKSIINNYKIFLDNYNNIEFDSNSQMQKNINGLIAVLNSQVSFFEEKDNFGINPISKEKKQIISKYLDNIYFDIENLINNIKNDFQIIDENNQFYDYLFQNIFESYKINAKNCFYNINSTENRQILSYYNDILEEEKEILASIIKVQVKALEDLCQNDFEIELVANILKPIKEIYQFSTKRFNEHIENIKNINHNIDINFKNDEKKLFFEIKNILNFQNDNIVLNNFKILLSNFFQNVKNIKISKFELLIKKLNQSENIFKNIKSIFIKISEFIKQNMFEYNKTDFKEILNGILESIDIKIQTFNENEQLLNNLNFQILENFKKLKNSKLSIIDFKQTLKEIENIQPNEAINHIKNILFDFDFDNIIQTFENNLLDFQKNIILFEISTFQEIINYSVVRLRNQNNDFIQSFVINIDEYNRNINQILENNNIFVINPNPHSMFNTKEHELLMAEKSEQFKKGEIIKVLNCGYKTLDKVLIRANVIAAK